MVLSSSQGWAFRRPRDNVRTKQPPPLKEIPLGLEQNPTASDRPAVVLIRLVLDGGCRGVVIREPFRLGRSLRSDSAGAEKGWVGATGF